MEQTYILSVKVDNALRALQRIVSLLTRSRIGVEKMTFFPAQPADVFDVTIHMRAQPAIARRTLEQIRRLVETLEIEIKPLQENPNAQDEIRIG